MMFLRQQTEFDDRSRPCCLVLPLPNTVTVLRLAGRGVPDLSSSNTEIPFVAHRQESCNQMTTGI